MKWLNILALIISFNAITVYSKAQNTAIKTNPFQLCDGGKTYPYYEPELKYDGGFGRIKECFLKNYHKPIINLFANKSGIVKIAFVVNCKGEAGNYVVESCDFDYKPIMFSTPIVNRLLGITQSLKDWIPARNKNNEAVNSHKFLTFKIEKAELIEVFPK